MILSETDWTFCSGAWFYTRAPETVYCEVLNRKTGWGFNILIGADTFVNVAPYRSRMNAMIAALNKLEEVGFVQHA